ncbi:hypothetical protein ACW9HF_34395 [Nocardia gipuzkoensis]
MNRFLPTQGMGWAEFQAFVQGLLHSSMYVRGEGPRLVECCDYGAPGQKQDGIDHLGVFEDGSTLAVQDKEQAKLTPGQVTKIVDAASFQADRYVIAYSGVASAAVRREIHSHPRWEIWDACDLLNRLWRLPLLVSARLLEQHWDIDTRRRFIDVAGADHFLTVDAYFRPWMQPTSLFHHVTPFVGDEAMVEEVVAALVGDDIRVVVLSGPAGQGKSRLLLEVLRRCEARGVGMRAHVRSDHLPLDAMSLRALDDDCVIVIEDVHRDMEAFETLLGYVRRTPNTKLVATLRPSSDAALSQAIARASFHTGEVFRREVMRLDRAQAEQLVQELTSDLDLVPGVSGRLVRQAKTMPFVAVVAIAMIRRGELATGRRTDADFRAEVLARYGTVVTEGVPDVDPLSVRSLLELIAALTPLDISDVDALDRIAEIMGTSRRIVMERLKILGDHGAILIVGNITRVIPDVLADELLATAAVVNGGDTGFVSAVWKNFGDRHGIHLIDTFAELEWRLRQSATDTSEEPPDLFAPIWSDVLQRVMQGDCGTRVTLLGYLTRTAATQPHRVLDLVRRIMAKPTPESAVGSVWRVTHGKVLEAAVALIATCGMAERALFGDALDLLWVIVRRKVAEDSATANAQHALITLATIRNATWPAAGQIVVEKVRRWLAEPSDHPTTVTPLFILEPLLEKSGSNTEQIGNNFRHCTYGIDPLVVGPLRRTVIGLLSDIVATSSIRRSIEAIGLLGRALREPRPDFGRDVQKREILGWEEDSLAIADALKAIAESAPDPLHRLAVWEAVHWHAERAESPRVRQLCTDVRDRLECRTDEDVITLCLAAPAWRRRAGTTGAFIIEQQKTERRSAASQLWNLGTAQAAIDLLAQQVRVITEARRSVLGLDFLFQEILDIRPSEPEALLDAVAAEPSGVLVSAIPVLLNGLACQDKARFMTILTQLVTDPGHAHAAIAGFRIYDWVSIVPDSTSVLLQATDNEDISLRSEAVRSLAGLLRKDSSHIALLPRFLDQHQREVREVIETVYGHYPLETVNTLNDAERHDLLSIVVTLDTDHSPFDQIITALALHDPATVIAAINEQAIAGKIYLIGIPNLSKAIADPHLLTAWLIDAANRDQRSRIQLEWVWPVVAGSAPTSAAKAAIRQIIDRGNEHELDFMCTALARCEQFALNEPSLTNRLIEALDSHTPEARARAYSSLISGALPMERRRTPGEPDIRVQQSAEQAKNLAGQTELRHSTRALFTEIARIATADIQDDLYRDKQAELEP